MILTLLAAAVAVSALDHTFEPNFRSEASLYSAQIRQAIMTRPGFDKILPPTSNRSASGSSYSGAGTDVSMQIRFFKVQQVQAGIGTMRIKVWLRMSWIDTRLAWNESEFGGVSTTYFNGEGYSGHETSEIWVPDVQPYNSNEGIYLSLEPSLVRVSSSGETFWSRPGSLDIMCRFSGLVAFPFDQLSCPVEFGGWSFSGGHQGINLLNGGYSFSKQELTSGSSYQEHEIEAVSVALELYTYPNYPSEPWPIVMYTIKLKRATFFYVPIVLFPGVTITLLSFAVFWTDTESADALGYGISVIVVNLLSTVVIIGLLPVCGELIWIDLFCFVNTTFCCLALAQSAFNIMLENKKDDSLLPLWLRRCFKKSTVFESMRTSSVLSSDDLSFVKEASFNERSSVNEAMRLLKFSATVNESVAGVLYRQATGRVTTPGKRIDHQSSSQAAMGKADPIERARKLTFFEHLFFMLDEDSSLFIDADECSSLLSYTLLDLDPVQRQGLMSQYDSATKDNKLSRVEFCCMCADLLWDVPEDQLERAVTNAKSARTGQERRNSRYWKDTATHLDSWARIIVPALYFLSLIVIFHLELSDQYTKAEVETFTGFGGVHLNARGTILIIVYIVICIVSFVGWMNLRQRTAAEYAAEQTKLREAARRVTARASMSTSLEATRAAILGKVKSGDQVLGSSSNDLGSTSQKPKHVIPVLSVEVVESPSTRA